MAPAGAGFYQLFGLNCFGGREKPHMNDAMALSQYVQSSPRSEMEAPKRPVLNATIQLSGHAAIFALAFLLAIATASECQGITHLQSLLYGTVLWGWWGCIASAFWSLRRRIPIASTPSARAISSHVLMGSALGFAHLLLLGSLSFRAPGWPAHATSWSALTSMLHINRFGLEFLIYGFVVGIIGIAEFQMRAQRAAMQSLELQKELSAAHLRALQMQLEPHFLFNTLNAITTLVEFGRQKQAVEMLSHLNTILKSTFSRTTPEKITLSQELEIMENYLAIEQVRFADRLRVEIKVEPKALDGLVPCFLLQPLVENAIRHGVANCENQGLVEAMATCDGSILNVRVRDSGSRMNGHSQNGHGIGLKNTRERLAHFYRDDYAMQAQALEAGGFEVSIRIPYERSGG
jgi:sensor histidine kinase YesM